MLDGREWREYEVIDQETGETWILTLEERAGRNIFPREGEGIIEGEAVVSEADALRGKLLERFFPEPPAGLIEGAVVSGSV